MTKSEIKICGITNIEDAMEISALGVGALGFICYKKSPRFIKPDLLKKISTSLPSRIKKVGVFVDQSPTEIIAIVKNCQLDMVQLHGNEGKSHFESLHLENIKFYKSLPIKQLKDLNDLTEDPTINAYLLDSWDEKLFGGTGKILPWNELAFKIYSLKKSGKKVILAGGLTTQNVREAILSCQPSAVDVSSGLENEIGKKNLDLVRKFIAQVATTSVFENI